MSTHIIHLQQHICIACIAQLAMYIVLMLQRPGYNKLGFLHNLHYINYYDTSHLLFMIMKNIEWDNVFCTNLSSIKVKIFKLCKTYQ